MKVTVTQADIDGATRFAPACGPLARALSRQTGHPWSVMGTTATDVQTTQRYRLTGEVANMQTHFDQGYGAWTGSFVLVRA